MVCMYVAQVLSTLFEKFFNGVGVVLRKNEIKKNLGDQTLINTAES
jgi:hypothetical protein